MDCRITTAFSQPGLSVGIAQKMMGLEELVD